MQFEQSRRGLITGLVALVAAPAIVRATSLMPVKAVLGLQEKLTPGPLGMFDPIPKDWIAQGYKYIATYNVSKKDWEVYPYDPKVYKSFNEVAAAFVGPDGLALPPPLVPSPTTVLAEVAAIDINLVRDDKRYIYRGSAIDVWQELT